MPGYVGARKCFQENINLIPRPMSDPQAWNLNNGLEEFAHAVQNDMTALEHKLDQILQILTALRRR